MITARQARELAGLTVDDYAAQLSIIIENAAKTKVFETIVLTTPFNTWLSVPNNTLSVAERGTLVLLRRNGFNLSLHQQDAITGLKISW